MSRRALPAPEPLPKTTSAAGRRLPVDKPALIPHNWGIKEHDEP